MAWVRVSDDFYDHPGHAGLDLAAWGLWVWSLAWCNRNLTDGLVPLPVVRRMDPDGDASEALIAAGRWEDEDGTIRVHDYLDFQPSAEQIRLRREKDRERWRRRAESGDSPPDSDGTPHGVEAESTSAPPSSQPQPQPSSLRSEGGARKRATRPTEAFELTPELKAWGAEKVPDVDLVREREAWLEWCAANGKTYVDHPSAFRTWCRRAQSWKPEKPRDVGPPTRVVDGRTERFFPGTGWV